MVTGTAGVTVGKLDLQGGGVRCVLRSALKNVDHTVFILVEKKKVNVIAGRRK